MDEDKISKRLGEICAEIKRTKDTMQRIRLLHEVNMILDTEVIKKNYDVIKEILEESRKDVKKRKT